MMMITKKYPFHETMAAVSVLKDFTADRGLNDIPHSMLNIEDKLQDSRVKIKSSKLFCTKHLQYIYFFNSIY